MSRDQTITLPTWKAALKDVATKPVKVVFVGSSTTQGGNSTAASRRYIEVLGDMIRRRYNATADKHVHVAISADDSSFALTGTTSRDYNGLSLQNIVMQPGATATLSLFGKSFSVLFVQGSGHGSFTVTIDGGTPTVVTPSTTGTNMHTGEVLVDAGAYGLHSIVITATNMMRLCGVVAHMANHDRGLIVYNSGIGGSTSASFAGNVAHTQRLNSIGPHLVVLMIGSNDYSSSIPIATYRAQVQQIVTDIRGGVSSNPDILIVQPYKRFDVTWQVAPWSDYGKACAEVAAQNPGCYSLDIARFYPDSQATDFVNAGGGTVAARGLIDNDGIHQTDIGHAFMARLILPALL